MARNGFKYFKSATVCAATLLLAGCNEAPREVVEPLPHLAAKIDETTVSGISSGAYMAGQFEMAEAKLVTGAAIIAGGPYGCSESVFADAIPGPGSSLLNLSKAVNGCMLDLLGLWGAANGKTLAEKAKRRADNNEIGPIADVATDKIYLFTGKNDTTVMPSIVQHAADFYAALGVPAENVKFVKDVPAGHAFVTENSGEACERSEAPYVVDCDYDQAGDLLRHFYGTLVPPSTAQQGTYLSFDQKPFGASTSEGGLDDTGVAYVPAGCREQPGCRVHIAFHGCAQSRGAVGDTFVKESGFARWADTNRLIVLFPQVLKSPMNPQGCWDWWGYTGRDYLTRSAPQIAAVRAMLDALQSPRGGA